MKRKTLKIVARASIILVLISAVWLQILQAQEYQYPKQEEIRLRLNYLKRVINEPLEKGFAIRELGNASHEFMLFSYAYSSYALTNLALKDSLYKEDAIQLIRESIIKAQDSQVSSPFGIKDVSNYIDSVSEYSVLYLGHLNLMIGCYKLFSKDSRFDQLYDKISANLFKRYSKSPFLNLESYPSSIWIPDNTVAIASLKLNSYHTKSAYESICSKWVQYVKQHYTDPETGVLYSTINSENGKAMEEPRGSMLGWSIMFIYQFDSEFAIDLYKNYKKHFSTNFMVFRLFRERHDSKETGNGDIDSGPLFRGYSIPANEFALSASILAGDYKTARKLERLIDFGTKKVKGNNEIKYKVRFVKMNISPMAEALVLNSLTSRKWMVN